MSPRRAARLVSIVAGWSVLGVFAGLALAVLGGIPLGWRGYTVMSGSMRPNIQVGDVVVVRPLRPLAASPGDVVTFRDPQDPGRLITHRAREITAEAGMVTFVTKGDANNSTETWSVPDDGRIGLVVYRLRWIGYVLHTASSPLGRVLLIGIPALGLGVLAMVRIWRSPEGDEQDDESPAAVLQQAGEAADNAGEDGRRPSPRARGEERPRAR